MSNADNTERNYVRMKKPSIARRAGPKAAKLGYDARQLSARKHCPDRCGEVGALTVGPAARVETMTSGESHPRSLELAKSINREGSLQLLRRLAPREERLERLLRLIRPHLLREHF